VTTKQTGVRGKVRDGNVVSDKMQKTIVVVIESNFRHRLYKKTVRRVRRFMVHDETEQAKLGDLVRIIESSPVSRRKRWRLLEVLTRVELPEVAPESIDLELLGEVKPEEEAVEDAAVAPAEPEAVPEEAVATPEAEAEAPEEVEVEEEIEIKEAVPEEGPIAETADVTPREPEGAEPEEAPAGEAEDEAESEEKPS
jgi:small subunit ribosomal protein S17